MNKTDTQNNMAKLENTLRERSQGQKVTYVIPFTEIARTDKFLETEGRLVDVRMPGKTDRKGSNC